MKNLKTFESFVNKEKINEAIKGKQVKMDYEYSHKGFKVTLKDYFKYFDDDARAMDLVGIFIRDEKVYNNMLLRDASVQHIVVNIGPK